MDESFLLSEGKRTLKLSFSLRSIPMNLTATASAAGLTSLTGALTQYAPQAVTALSEQEGLTLFAPVNSAFESAMSLIGTLNDTTIANVLLK